MDFSNKEKDSTNRVIGFSVIVGLHALAGYAVMSGLGTQLIEVIKKPVTTKIVEEVKRPPPPPDTPPPPPAPPVAAPPPPYIPPPEIPVSAPANPNTIQATTSVAPESKALPTSKPSPSAVPAPAPAPPAPAPVSARVNVNDCERPEYPRNAAREGAEGTVRISFLVGADGRVKEAKIDKSSGNRDLDRAAKDKLSECNKFKAGIVDGKPAESWATVDYVWKLE